MSPLAPTSFRYVIESGGEQTSGCACDRLNGSSPAVGEVSAIRAGDHPVIPADINDWDRRRITQYYHRDLGWAVHPLYAHDRGGEGERGKKPIARGWKNHRAGDVTSEYLDRHFGNGAGHNVGVVVRGPYVFVDLDSKADEGASVREWIASRPELADVPRERTGGGAHLTFICPDLPPTVLETKNALTSKVGDRVTAELYKDGNNIAVSPSIHKSGALYLWEITGAIPEIPWHDLKRVFGFVEPVRRGPGRPPKPPPWQHQYTGDLVSLDIVAVCRELGVLGERVGPEGDKWSVKCPWASEHSSPTAAHGPPGSDTVVFEGHDDKRPAFKCLHAHCAGRSLEQFLAWAELQKPGVVDRNCRRLRIWSEGQRGEDGRPRVILPGPGVPTSDFASEMGEYIGPKDKWFQRGGAAVAVETRRVSENIASTAFCPVQAAAACSAVERFVETGLLTKDPRTHQAEFVAQSMTRECATKLLAAGHFIERLPEVIRILDVPIPILRPGGEIVYPAPGYNRDLRVYVDAAAPVPETVQFERAVGILRDLHASFPFRDEQSRAHAIARIITPFCRGVMGWDARFPLWSFAANRPRAGKDYLAGLTHIVFEGTTCEDAPLGRDPEETRKRITAAVMAGRRMMHLANCQYHIDDPFLTEAITQKVFAARNIGSTAAGADIRLPMEIEFSISANIGLTYREDLAPRMRQIFLAFYDEDPNGRRFREPDLHGRVLRERPVILGAIGALVDRWIEAGRPDGPTPFNSFPEWARVVGGIMAHCGLGDPCLPHGDEEALGGDLKTRGMRAVFRLGHAHHPGQWVPKGQLFDLVKKSDDEDLGFYCQDEGGDDRKFKKRLGMALTEFNGRELCGIRLEIDPSGKGAAQKIRFEGVGGSDGRPCEPDPRKPGNPGNAQTRHELPGKIIPNSAENEELITGAVETGGITSEVSGVSMVNPSSWHLVGTRVDLDAIAGEILGARESVALDIETCGPKPGGGLDPWRGDIRLLQLRLPGRDPWIIDLREVGYDLGPLAAALKGTELIGHNIKFDLLWLRVKCGLRLPRVFCTMTAARLLSAGPKREKRYHGLDRCLERHLGVRLDADHSSSDWGQENLSDEMLRYAARDVAHLHALRDRLTAEIKTAGLDRVAEVEMRLIPAVAEMENTGMYVDRGQLECLGNEARQRATQLTEKLRQTLGRPDLNPNSHPQLKAALNAAGVRVDSTAEAVLNASADCRIVPIVLEYRGATKRASWAESMIESIGPDGRIHGQFNPTGADTGRFSSREPNLQNIPRGDARRCFTAAAGRKLVIADYSQVELRAAAVLAGEPRMMDAFKRGEDLHRATASALLGKPAGQVTKDERQTAKAVSFGLLFGQGSRGLVRYALTSYGVSLSLEEAEQFRRIFFQAYPGLKEWHDRCWSDARDGRSETRTRLGRRRLIPDGADEWDRFSAAVNTPVQGSCADGIKLAMLAIAEALPGSARIVATVHDELVLEAEESVAEQVRDLVADHMRRSMGAVFPEVPIVVEAKVADNWAEK